MNKIRAATLLVLAACGGETALNLPSSGGGGSEGGAGAGASDASAVEGDGGAGDRDAGPGSSDSQTTPAGEGGTPDGGTRTTLPDGGGNRVPDAEPSADAKGPIDAPENDAPGAPTIGDDGYVSLSTGSFVFGGYVSSFIGGSSSSIALTYGPSSFCASGTVGANSTYQSYAGAGFNVDQTRSATGGSVSSLLLTGKSMTVRFANYGDSPLEVEVTNSSNTYWCYELGQMQSPAVIPLGSFNTHCWDGSGDAFVPGTAITTIQLVVPGSASGATPYDFCFLGLTIP